jgi:hypothetical protein
MSVLNFRCVLPHFFHSFRNLLLQKVKALNNNDTSALNFNLMPESQQHYPRISICIRFEPKMKNKLILQKVLADRAKAAEVELLNQYPQELVKPVMQKLHNVLKGIKNEADQSIAIFVCPVLEKVMYFTYNPYLSEFNRLHPLRPLKVME